MSTPLKREKNGVCARSVCLCERDRLGDECIWLRPMTDQELALQELTALSEEMRLYPWQAKNEGASK